MKSYEALMAKPGKVLLHVVVETPLAALLDARAREMAASRPGGRRRVPRAEVVRAILEAALLPREAELKKL